MSTKEAFLHIFTPPCVTKHFDKRVSVFKRVACTEVFFLFLSVIQRLPRIEKSERSRFFPRGEKPFRKRKKPFLHFRVTASQTQIKNAKRKRLLWQNYIIGKGFCVCDPYPPGNRNRKNNYPARLLEKIVQDVRTSHAYANTRSQTNVEKKSWCRASRFLLRAFLFTRSNLRHVWKFVLIFALPQLASSFCEKRDIIFLLGFLDLRRGPMVPWWPSKWEENNIAYLQERKLNFWVVSFPSKRAWQEMLPRKA